MPRRRLHWSTPVSHTPVLLRFQAEDWLYGDGESATVEAYNDKLADVDRTIRDACPKYSTPSARP